MNPASTPAQTNPDRMYFLDGLRVLVMLSVVLLHAAISYMTVPMPDLLWAVRDPATSPVCDWIFWGLQGLSMTVFFFVSGFLAASQSVSRGARGFLERRLQRIVKPLVFGAVAILPVTYYVWSCGWLVSGQCTLREFLLGDFGSFIKRNLYGPAHLWFLEYLLILSLIYFAWQTANLYSRRQPCAGQAGMPPKIVLFVLATFLILFLNLGARFNFRNSFIPDLWRLGYYGVFFFAGIWFYSLRTRLEGLAKRGVFYLIASALFYVLQCILLKKYLSSAAPGAGHLALAAASALFSWTALLGCLGVFSVYFNRPNAVIRYLLDASYWIYLCHPPVVALMQIAFFGKGFPVLFKLSTVFAAAVAFGLLSYQVLVRRSFLGVMFGSKAGIEKKDRPASFKTKIILTAVLGAAIFSFGAGYQCLYNRQKQEYTRAITGFYQKYFHRAPDAIGLDHWVMMALNKWGLEKVERVGFVEAKAKGAG